MAEEKEKAIEKGQERITQVPEVRMSSQKRTLKRFLVERSPVK